MVTASFVGILRTLAIIILTYYAIKFLLRLLAPYIMQKVVKKAEQSFHQQQQQFNQRQDTAQQSSTLEKEKKKKTEKVGEYIDFEEID